MTYQFSFFLLENLGGRERRDSERRRLQQGDYGCLEGKRRATGKTDPMHPFYK